MSITPAPADPVLHAGIRAVLAGAARLAQRLLRRPVRSGRRRHAAVAAEVAQAAARAFDAVAPRPPDADDGAPWHDPAMPLAERMKLAEGKPLPRRMMAAMAQQDCGQCGYNCKDYADALFAKTEERLNLCVPGGKETARMLKQLYRGARRRRAAPRAPAAAEPSRLPAPRAGRSRDNPVYATFLSRRRLNKPARKKKPGISTSISPATDLDYAVGDSFGIFPGERSGARRRA